MWLQGPCRRRWQALTELFDEPQQRTDHRASMEKCHSSPKRVEPHLSCRLTFIAAPNNKRERKDSDQKLQTDPATECQAPETPHVPSPSAQSQEPATDLREKSPNLTTEVPATVILPPIEVPQQHDLLPNRINRDSIGHQYRHENEQYEAKLKALQEEIELLRKDNDLLRSAIVQKGKDTQPLRGEEYYARLFKELKADIETWMAKQAKANRAQALSEIVGRTLLEKFSNFGLRSQWSAEFLRTDKLFETLYSDTRSRIQLGRHIVASILFDQVFAPFAFGLPGEWAKAMAWVENDNSRGLSPREYNDSSPKASYGSAGFSWFISPWAWPLRIMCAHTVRTSNVFSSHKWQRFSDCFFLRHRNKIWRRES